MCLVRLGKGIHTVLVGPDGDGIARRAVADARARDHPDPVLGPLFQLVQGELGDVEFDDGRLAVAAAALDVVQPVVDDPAVGPLDRGRLPLDQYRGRARRVAGYIARRGPGDCITLDYRGCEGKEERERERQIDRERWRDRETERETKCPG